MTDEEWKDLVREAYLEGHNDATQFPLKGNYECWKDSIVKSKSEDNS